MNTWVCCYTFSLFGVCLEVFLIKKLGESKHKLTIPLEQEQVGSRTEQQCAVEVLGPVMVIMYLLSSGNLGTYV